MTLRTRCNMLCLTELAGTRTPLPGNSVEQDNSTAERWRIAYSGSMHVGQNPFFRPHSFC